MSQIVLDSSAVLNVLIDPSPPAGLLARVGSAELHAPHLLDTEITHALRRLVRLSIIGGVRAEAALVDLGDLPLIRYAHAPLTGLVWSMRKRMSAYDATFVALAIALEAPLVTRDRRLATAADGVVAVELH